MDDTPPNFPQRRYARLFVGILFLIVPTLSLAAFSEFKQEISEGRMLLCATHPTDRLYTFIPPEHGHFIRFGLTTLCYVSEAGIPEAIPFVETDAVGLVTDAGILQLTPVY